MGEEGEVDPATQCRCAMALVDEDAQRFVVPGFGPSFGVLLSSLCGFSACLPPRLAVVRLTPPRRRLRKGVGATPKARRRARAETTHTMRFAFGAICSKYRHDWKLRLKKPNETSDMKCRW